MHLPELGFVDGAHGRVGLDVRNDGVDVPPIALATDIRHEQDAAESGAERDAKAEHRDGERRGQSTVEMDAGGGWEEGEDEHGAGAREREQVGRVAEDGRQGGDVGYAQGFADAGVVL